MLQLNQRRFGIVTNGYSDGPPQALVEFLVRNRAGRVVVISHPLLPEEAPRHELRVIERDGSERTRTMRRPSRPPLTYPLDLISPVLPPTVDTWFGFNALACAQGLALRRLGRAKKVVYWCVDFVPQRFGSGALTELYERLDGACCRASDARFELSRAALDARTARHGGGLAPAFVVPMGAWTDRAPVTAVDGYRAQRIVYLGHLIERQGVSCLLAAIAHLAPTRPELTLEVVGAGPLAESLEAQATALGIERQVRFHGFVRDYREVERILSSASVAVAPYKPAPDSFTRFADPGKLKAYLGAGLPVVLTRVPPNADDLERCGAATIVGWSPSELAEGIERLLSSPDAWTRARRASLDVALEFDWERIFTDAFTTSGVA